jgi:uncharacterized protein
MLIDFTVENYRSIRDAMTLSFVAQKSRRSKTAETGRAKSDDTITPGYRVPGRNFSLLPVAAVYGPNASGKSNVLRALSDLLDLMEFGAQSEEDLSRDFMPYRLDKDCSRNPTRFNLRIAVEEDIFDFDLSVFRGMIVHEALSYSPVPEKRQSVRSLYHRQWDPQQEQYLVTAGSSFVGPHLQLLGKLQKHTPYISLFNSLNIDMVQALVDWLVARPFGFLSWDDNSDFDLNYAARLGQLLHENHESAKRLIRSFDVGLSDIIAEEIPISSDPESFPDYRIWAVHDTAHGPVRWNFTEESLGTRRLFCLLHPLLSVLSDGTFLVVDEFGSNFHPKIGRTILELFQNPKTNPYGAQLLFSSHDSSLWRSHLRRDQIWLTEKQPDGATKLFSLSDFKPRNDLALEKAYLDGRFGAVPMVPDAEDLMAPIEKVAA